MPHPFLTLLLATCLSFAAAGTAHAQATPHVKDPALAAQLGADENGMRPYILVILKTGSTRVPDGPARTAMFQGHFANMQRLADAGKLVLAGPFTDKDGWRGLFILATDSKTEAEALVGTDPVITNGEMVAEYHALYSTAALMSINDIHKQIAPEAGEP